MKNKKLYPIALIVLRLLLTIMALAYSFKLKDVWLSQFSTKSEVSFYIIVSLTFLVFWFGLADIYNLIIKLKNIRKND